MPSDAQTNASWNWVLIPTAVALALVSLALSWQNRKVSQALEKQRQATKALLHDREETEKLVGVLAAADTLTVKLAPAADTIGVGVVKYNGRLGMVIYSAELPAAPGGKSYQMWLVPASGAPISVGLMEKGGRAVGPVWIAEVPAHTEAKTFAITVEPAGGAPQPTGPKILVGAS
jgi:anti-sigma-K factor RskA